MAEDRVTTRDPHAVLGVPADATPEDIKRAYRLMSKAWHPDRNPDPGAAEMFRTVTEAYKAALGLDAALPAKHRRAPRRKRAPRGGGTVFKRKHSAFYWIAFNHAGRRYEGSSQSDRQKAALDLLDKCRDACRAGDFVSIEAIRDGTRPTQGVCLADLRAAVLEDARRNGLSSLRRKEQTFKALVRHLGEWTPVEDIDKARIDKYASARLRDPVGRARDKQGKPKNPKTIANGTVNREYDQLRLGFNLLGLPAPRWKKLKEAEPRMRFPQPGEVERVLAYLPAHLRGPMTLLRWTGWRVREALRLTWARVDMDAGTIRLEHRDTKTRRPRLYPFRECPALAALIAERRAETDRWQREHSQLVEYVFWQAATDTDGRPAAKPVTLWSKAWGRACRRAAVADLIAHDMRRGVARDLIRSNVEESVAMRLLGHKSPSIFRRYNITADDDLRAAVRKHARAAQERATEAKQREA